jgi:hypothetical protein
MPPEKGVKTALNKRLQKDALFGLRRNVHESGDSAQWFHYCSLLALGGALSAVVTKDGRY